MGTTWQISINERLHVTGLPLAEAQALATGLCAEFGVRVTLIFDERR